jgi:hypothetical protein
MGIVLVLVAVGLIFIGRPNAAGQHPPFLRFEASLVLYPPVVLVFFAMGIAAIIASLLSR